MTLRVDYDGLGELGARLMGLKEEFDGAEASMGGHRDALDHDGLSGELEAFATNWSDKKREVGERLAEVSGMASGAADCYRDADHGICDQISA